jgi:hypothetical protein
LMLFSTAEARFYIMKEDQEHTVLRYTSQTNGIWFQRNKTKTKQDLAVK